MCGPGEPEIDNVYRVTVTATDPSLAATPVHVAITVTDLNEAPAFAVTTNPKAWTINEDDGDETTEPALSPLWQMLLVRVRIRTQRRTWT